MDFITKLIKNIHDDFLKYGLDNTAEKYDLSRTEIRNLTMKHARWKGTWTNFLKHMELVNAVRTNSQGKGK